MVEHMARTEKEIAVAKENAITAVDHAISALDVLVSLYNGRDVAGFDTVLLATAYGNLHALKASILLEANR